MNMPTAFPLVRDMHELKRATSDALVAQYKVGWAECKRYMWAKLFAVASLIAGCAFVAGIVFAVFWAEAVVRWLA